ncbi:ABC transporter substrate-binding protein [Pseudomonas kielensis]|uniref:ABC transporter substrate-binding protein n=1 Tax=Pseudomonas kielensis TaxID=2762577 RepID=UPI00265E849C|nr:ABC transporter substrate-binding protein [Pseudomonas kielensis]WKL54155.1 ABC transporter substrate-binding protein [Pseudomonas kielensis]
MKMLPLRAVVAATVLMTAIGASAKPLVVCTEASPEGFDPVLYTTAVTADAAAETLFNRLVDFKPGTAQIQPALAESWDISPDGLQYTFHLRPGVAFHTTDYFKPTRTLNADDVVWSFQRQLDPNHPWHKQSAVGFPYFESMDFQNLLKRVEKVDDMSVRFTLNRPEAPFLLDLGMAFTSIHSAEYAAQLQKADKMADLNSKPIGTGPFIFQRYAKDAQVRYKANPHYFRGKPPADPLIFAITPDNNTRLQKLKANECQVALYPKPDDVPSIQADPALQIATIAAMSTGYTAINTSRPYLSDVRVRRAIELALDKQNYVDTLYGKGNAIAAVNPYPPALLGYNTTLKNPPQDLDQARALLKEAGVPPGTVFTLYTRNAGGPTNPNPQLGAQLIQADLAKVGITIDIRVMEWAEMLKRAKKGEHDLVSAGWSGDNGDPDNFLGPLLSCEAAKNGENYSRWCNPQFQALITQARATTGTAERAALYEKALVILHDEVVWVDQAHPKMFTAMRKNVDGYYMNPLTTNNFATTQVK